MSTYKIVKWQTLPKYLRQHCNKAQVQNLKPLQEDVDIFCKTVSKTLSQKFWAVHPSLIQSEAVSILLTFFRRPNFWTLHIYLPTALIHWVDNNCQNYQNCLTVRVIISSKRIFHITLEGGGGTVLLFFFVMNFQFKSYPRVTTSSHYPIRQSKILSLSR